MKPRGSLAGMFLLPAKLKGGVVRRGSPTEKTLLTLMKFVWLSRLVPSTLNSMRAAESGFRLKDFEGAYQSCKRRGRRRCRDRYTRAGA